jgi:hypothetical protein
MMTGEASRPWYTQPEDASAVHAVDCPAALASTRVVMRWTPLTETSPPGRLPVGRGVLEPLDPLAEVALTVLPPAGATPPTATRPATADEVEL